MEIFSHLPLIELSGKELSYLEGKKLIQRLMEITGLSERSVKDVYYHIRAGGSLYDTYKSAILAIGAVFTSGEIISPWRCGVSSDGLSKSVRSGLTGGVVKIDSNEYFMVLLSIRKGKDRIYPYCIRLYDEEELCELNMCDIDNLRVSSVDWLVKKWLDKVNG
jgi:hypothetical protein